MNPAGLPFRDAVWCRLMESKPWEPSRAGRGLDAEDQPRKTESAAELGRASGVPQEKSQTQKDVRVPFLLLDHRQGKTPL